MTEQDRVRAFVRNLLDGSVAEQDLGETDEFRPNDISIGSDPGCTIVLPSPEVAPVAARLIAASNHLMLRRLPPGVNLPLLADMYPLQRGDERVDYWPFQIGHFEVCINRDDL